MELKLSRYIVDVTIPQFESEPTADRLLYSIRSGKTIRLSHRYLDVLYAADFSLLPDKLFTLLFDNEILIPAEEEEKEAMLTRNLLALEDVTGNSATLLIPIKNTPDNNFFDAVMSQLNDVIAAIGTNTIKGFRYTIRLLLAIRYPAPDLNWLSLLDERLREIKSPVKTTFTLNIVYTGEGYNNLVMPALRLLTVNRLFFLFNEKNIDLTPGIDIIQRDLLTSQDHPGMTVQLLFNIAAKSWANWSTPFIDAVTAIAKHRKVIIEFAVDAPVSAMEELEKELIYFLSQSRIRCKWLPRPNRVLPFSNLSSQPVHHLGIQLINTDLNLDGKELLQMAGYLSESSSHPYYQPEDFKATTPISNIQERILATAGMPLRGQLLETR